MKIYLTNAIPNSFLTAFDSTRVKKITPEKAFELLTYSDLYQECDDTITLRTFRENVICAIGHGAHAERVRQIFTELNGKYVFEVPVSRERVTLEYGDIVTAAILDIPHRRDGGMWSPEELSQFPIQFLLLYNGAKEDEDHQWRFKMTEFA